MRMTCSRDRPVEQSLQRCLKAAPAPAVVAAAVGAAAAVVAVAEAGPQSKPLPDANHASWSLLGR
jgi:hypothetical protein